jgi:lipopolysaccharide export LptBFGC system permease protein LptF
MSDEPNQTQPNEPKKFSALALVLAFVPSLLLVGTFSFSSFFFSSHHGNPPAIVLAAMCLISVACCFVSSFLLFQHNKVLATIFGILFTLLNGLISFFFGCTTLLTVSRF